MSLRLQCRIGAVDAVEQLETLEEDLRALFETKEVEKPITLYQAMARALKYNMDHRLAVAEESVANGNVALARLGMLPSLEMKGQYIGRNNQSASSSQSYVTGTQSLESSISTEKHRRTGSLEASWDILDTGLAFVESRQETDCACIAAERRRKVIHNIVQDVRYAYWQAAGAQEMLAKIDSLTNKGNAIIENIRKAEDAGVKSPEESLKTQSRLLGTMDELMTMRSQLSFARIELASLMNVPPAAAFTLATDAKDLPFKKRRYPVWTYLSAILKNWRWLSVRKSGKNLSRNGLQPTISVWPFLKLFRAWISSCPRTTTTINFWRTTNGPAFPLGSRRASSACLRFRPALNRPEQSKNWQT